MSLTIRDDVAQGDPEWHDLRRGIVTASTVGRIVAKASPDATAVACETCSAEAGTPCLSMAAKKTPTPIKTIHDHRWVTASTLPATYETVKGDVMRAVTTTLVAERITGYTYPTYSNDDMLRGQLHEPIARDKYAEVNDVEVGQVGILLRDDWGFTIGASPDGLIGDNGGLEIKAPRAKGHIETIVADAMPQIHMAQVQTSLLVSGREWWDFVSFCGGLPLFTKRIYPDAAWQAAIVAAVTEFEEAAAQLTHDYLTRAANLPATDAVPDLYDLQVI